MSARYPRKGIKFNESKQKGPTFNERNLHSVTSFGKFRARKEQKRRKQKKKNGKLEAPFFTPTQYQFRHTFFISSSKIQ